MHKRILIPVIVLLVIGVGGGLWWNYHRKEAPVDISTIKASGFIESTNVGISPEISGRIISIAFDEGDQVTPGDAIIKLDDSIQQAQLKQAQATLQVAQSALQQAQAGLPVAQAVLQQAQAAQNQAKIYMDGAKTAWKDAQEIQQNPLEIDIRIAQAQSQLDLAEKGLEYAEDITGSINDAVYPFKLVYATQQRDGARIVLDSLLAIKNNPQSLKASTDQLQAAYQVASAAAEGADKATQTAARQVDVTDKAAQTAAKQVDQAQASLELAQVNLSRTVIASLVAGTVTQRNAEIGDLAQPGISVLTLSDLKKLTLTIYVPERQIGLVKLGQKANVAVDAYPGQVFQGTVTFISSAAEFTPKNVQTVEERAKTVIAVKITLPNPEQKLKSGMPADAGIITQ